MSDEETVQSLDRRAVGSTIERHASTVGIAIIIAILLWVGDSILEQADSQGKLSGDIRVMASEVNHLKQMINKATANRYTSLDAARDKIEYTRQYDIINKRVDGLEERYHSNTP